MPLAWVDLSPLTWRKSSVLALSEQQIRYPGTQTIFNSHGQNLAQGLQQCNGH